MPALDSGHCIDAYHVNESDKFLGSEHLAGYLGSKR